MIRLIWKWLSYLRRVNDMKKKVIVVGAGAAGLMDCFLQDSMKGLDEILIAAAAGKVSVESIVVPGIVFDGKLLGGFFHFQHILLSWRGNQTYYIIYTGG